MVERFFRDLSENRIKRDSFTSVAELELAIDLHTLAAEARRQLSGGTGLTPRSPRRACA
jgi:hypothetical protein